MVKDLDILLCGLLLVVHFIFLLFTCCIWFVKEHLIQLLHKLVILSILFIDFLLLILSKGWCSCFLIILLLQGKFCFHTVLNWFTFFDILLFITSNALIEIFFDFFELILLCGDSERARRLAMTLFDCRLER